MSAALMNYEVRRQGRLSSSGSTTVEEGVPIGRAEVIKKDQNSDQVLEI